MRPLSDSAKLAYLFLISQGKLTGVISRLPEEFAATIGWSVKKWLAAVEELAKSDRVSIGYPNLIWVKNHLDHQFFAPGRKVSPKQLKGIQRELEQLPQGAIIQQVIGKYGKKIKYPIDTLSIGYPSQNAEDTVVVVVKDVVKDKEKTFLSETKFSDEVVSLTNLLISKVLTNDPKAKTPPLSENGPSDPRWTGWAKEADLLLRVDERPFKEAEQLTHWCQDDHFWKANIRSMAKFRQQYPQLRLKFKAEQEWQPQEKETEKDRIRRLTEG